MNRPVPEANLFERLNSVKAPRILYTFRTANDNLRKALLDRTLWVANPLSFNDPFDCDLPFAIRGSPEEMIAATERLIASRTLSPETQKRARASAAAGEFYRGEHLMEGARTTMRRSGIACFSEVPSDILMWSHYASKHQGVCLGFETKYSPWISQAKPVLYSEELPRLSIADDLRNFVTAFSFTKSSHWKYEREWRYAFSSVLFDSDSDPRRALPFAPETLRRVIFGCRMTSESRDEIRTLLNEWPTPVHLYQAITHPTQFRLSLRYLGVQRAGD